MKLALALLALLGSACVNVQTRTTADVIVETATGHEHYTYEGVEAFDVAPFAIACIATVIWYGGACWAYLAMPFDDQERVALDHVQADMASVGDCAHALNPRVEAIGWNSGGERKARLITLRGKTLRLDVAARTLCNRGIDTTPQPPAASSPPPPATAPPPKPKPPPPPPAKPLDPADG